MLYRCHSVMDRKMWDFCALPLPFRNGQEDVGFLCFEALGSLVVFFVFLLSLTFLIFFYFIF